MKKVRLLLIALLATVGWPSTAWSQTEDALQALIDQLASVPLSRTTDGVTDIDLSEYATPRTEALRVYGGVKIRFVNGTLRSDDSYDGTLLRIEGSSYVELSETATLKSGANTYAYTGLVEMAGGELLISGGSILPYKGNFPWGGYDSHACKFNREEHYYHDGGKCVRGNN